MDLLVLDSVGRRDLIDSLIAELQVLLKGGGVLDLEPDNRGGDQERRSAGSPL